MDALDGRAESSLKSRQCKLVSVKVALHQQYMWLYRNECKIISRQLLSVSSVSILTNLLQVQVYLDKQLSSFSRAKCKKSNKKLRWLVPNDLLRFSLMKNH